MAIIITTIMKLEREFKDLKVTDKFLESFKDKPIYELPGAKGRIIGKINKAWLEGDEIKTEQEMVGYDFAFSGVIKEKKEEGGITLIKDFDFQELSIVPKFNR